MRTKPHPILDQPISNFFPDRPTRQELDAAAKVRDAAPAMQAALREAERFMAYFAGETNGFAGGGTPNSCLAMIRDALKQST